MFLKSFLLTSVILLSYLVFFGQTSFPYDQEWKLIDSLMNKKNLPKSALAEVNKVYAAAKKDNREAEWVKSIIYKIYLEEVDDRNINLAFSGLENEISVAPPNVKALLKSIEGEQLYQYLQGHYYNMKNRTTIVGDSSLDMTTWTIARMNKKIRSLYLSSMDNPVLLKQTPLESFDPILIKGNARDLRPTLFDLLAWRALDYFRTDDPVQISETGNLQEENPAIFSEAPFFMHLPFSINDSSQNALIAINIYQQLLKLHAKDRRLDAWIDADIKRIQFAYQYEGMADKDSLYMNALGRITRQYPTLSASDQALFLQAQWWSNQANYYSPLADTTHRFDYLKAITICNQALSHSDSSEGKSNCEQLLNEIHRISFHINVEQVNLPILPFRMLVTYRKMNRLYGRIIRIDDGTRESFENRVDQDKFWLKLSRMPFEKSFQQWIPETTDYQEHRVEIKLDGLAIGQYALLTSSDSSFSSKAIMELTTFFCSSLAFIKNGLDYFVVDRDSGHPLQGVRVRTYFRKYGNSGFSYIPEKSYQTDERGFFHLTNEKRNQDLKLEFYYGKDYLSNSTYVNYYSNQYFNADKKKWRISVFTDRSIYRPGQTVFFKGIIISRDTKAKKFKAASQQQIKLFLEDVNNQRIDSVVLKSNDFGTIHGYFILPQNLLNGEFRIFDAETADVISFSVEEYKRPSFFIDYDSIRDSYQIGDTIQITGSAKAYAGNSITGAKMSWTVMGESVFPYPWLFRSYPSYAALEIGHGESITDTMGNFQIIFKAMTNKFINRATRPVYSYRVETTITNASGESRTATRVVNASDQAFEIISGLPLQGRLLKDSLEQIPVTTKNAAGVFIKEKLTVTIIALDGPSRLIRGRYWEQPDQFGMSEAEFIELFPNDEYQDEMNVKSWKQGVRVFEKTDSTRADGLFLAGKDWLEPFIPGWYLFEFKAKDKEGGNITDKRYIEITDHNAKSNSIAFNLIRKEILTAEPGDQVKIQTGSDANDLYLIRARQSSSDSATTYTFQNQVHGIIGSIITIRESDRGGFALNDAFVKNNRWYTCEHDIQVPWTNKELLISYQTWKDKTEPGAREKWKIKISGNRKDQLAAEVLTSMYDASLDQFKDHHWSVPYLYPLYIPRNSWTTDQIFSMANSSIRPASVFSSYLIFRNSYDHILSFNLGYLFGGGGPFIRGIPVNSVWENNDAPKTVMDIEFKTDVQGSEKPKSSDREMDMEENSSRANKNREEGNIQIRKNFNETAFFQPELKTDSDGSVEISFTMPDALTKWKWMLLANTKDLSFGYSEKMIVTQKELMLQTNMPRFFREGDTMLLPVKIANLSSQTKTGTVQLEWLNAENSQNPDQSVGNLKSSQPFHVNAAQSGVVFFPTIIPSHFSQPLLYRSIAKTNGLGVEYSDGEENIIPVLSNRMLVTESLPLNMDGKEEQHFSFDKLLKSNTSSSLQNQSLTIEYTTNPAWYAVQSLPYLMEFPYECAEQIFNRFYANALAMHIVKVSPTMRAIFEKWKNTDTAALLSNLQKNEALKLVIIRETPWVLQAQTETQQKKNLALLFDMIKMQQALKSAHSKLQQIQSEDGGFPWFKGGRNDQYITQYIISGIGRLKKLKAIPADFQVLLDKMVISAFDFLDQEIIRDYERHDKSRDAQNLNSSQIQYLYLRSFFSEISSSPNAKNAIDYYKKLSIEKWMKQSVYMQGMIALYLNRTGEIKISKDILASLKENATYSKELGLYWKSVHSGYYWQDAPVETQSLLIEAFQELNADQKSIDQMKFWLLQQKRTRHWPTTKATADACYALLLNRTDWLSSQQNVTVQMGNYKISSDKEKSESGTGYLKKQIPGDQVKPDMGNIHVTVSNQSSTVNRQLSTVNGQPSWGAIYWQYFENMDKISTAQTQLSITKNLFIEKNSDRGPVLELVSELNVLNPGDKLKMRIIIKTDRDLEYVHLKDMRAACLEPVNVLSGYQWQGGLGYYQWTGDASTSFFFDRLPKGSYVFEYPVFVTTSGNYSNGISSLECMYAPEFAAHSEGIRIQVSSK